MNCRIAGVLAIYYCRTIHHNRCIKINNSTRTAIYLNPSNRIPAPCTRPLSFSSLAHCETISKFLTQLFSPPPLPFVFYLFNFVARFWFSFLSCACFYSRLWLQFNFNCFIRWCRSENSLKSIFIYQFLPTITAVNFDLFDISIKM